MSVCIKLIWEETALREFSKYVLAKLYKRSKTSQIEALRKKYEALLQEDKKRKERNEYILEKMDNMRTCTTVAYKKHRCDIQLATGLLSNSNNCTLTLRTPSFEAQPYQSYHNKAPQVTDTGAATSLLRDIYNKFILIPKRWPNQVNQEQRENSNIDTNTIGQINSDPNSDWKTKYEILNKLKQEEKGYIDKSEYAESEHRQEYEFPNQSAKQYDPNLPEKDVSNAVTLENKNNGNKKNNDFLPKTKQLDNHEAPPLNDKEEQNYFNKLRSPDAIAAAGKVIECNGNNENKTGPEVHDHYPFTKREGSEQIEHLDDEGINPAYISYPPENIGKPLGDVPDVTEDVQFPIDVINVEEFTPLPNVTVKDGINVNPKGYGMNKSHFEPFAQEEFTPEKYVDDNDGVYVNPEAHVMSQDTFEPVSSQENEYSKTDTPVINNEKVEPNKQPEDPEMSLEREQNEDSQVAGNTQITYTVDHTAPVPKHVEDHGNPGIELENTLEIEEQPFYPEPINEIAYDQNVADVTWDTTQNENYQQNQEYYYEGPHEMPESVHVNEHEETDTPYDQNYEQQYNMANYEQQQYDESQPAQVAYDQQQEYDMQQYQHQEYDQSEQQVYDQQAAVAQYNPESEYDQQQYQQQYETVQQVEEQLNQEEGYTEIQGEQQEEVQKVATQEQPVA